MTHVSVEEIAKRIQGMTVADYDQARKGWGAEYPSQKRFHEVYGKSFGEVRDGTRGTKVAGLLGRIHATGPVVGADPRPVTQGSAVAQADEAHAAAVPFVDRLLAVLPADVAYLSLRLAEERSAELAIENGSASASDIISRLVREEAAAKGLRANGTVTRVGNELLLTHPHG